MQRLRKEAGLTLWELGIRCDPPIQPATISRWEKGQVPKVTDAENVAVNGFGLGSVDELTRGTKQRAS